MLLHRGDALQRTADRLALSRSHICSRGHIRFHKRLLSLQPGQLRFLLGLLKPQLVFQIQLPMLDVAALRQTPGILKGRIILRKRKGIHIELPKPYPVFPEFRLQYRIQSLADIIQMLIQRKGIHVFHLQNPPQKCLNLRVQHTVELIAQALCRQLLPGSHKPGQHLPYLLRGRLHIHGTAGSHIQRHRFSGFHLKHHVHTLPCPPWQRHLHGEIYEIYLRMKISSESQLCKETQKRKVPCLQHMHSGAQNVHDLSVPEKHCRLGFVYVEPRSELKILGGAFPRYNIRTSLIHYHCPHSLPPPPLFGHNHSYLILPPFPYPVIHVNFNTLSAENFSLFFVPFHPFSANPFIEGYQCSMQKRMISARR